jgi:hypothetical protein
VYDLAEQGAGAHAFVGLLSVCQLVVGRWLRAATHYADSRLAGCWDATQRFKRCWQQPGVFGRHNIYFTCINSKCVTSQHTAPCMTWQSREQVRLCGMLCCLGARWLSCGGCVLQRIMQTAG